MSETFASPDLTSLLDSWQITLTSENKSPTTIISYLRCTRLFLRWCAQTGRTAQLTREVVTAYTAEMIAGGAEANTVRLRLASLRQFSKWLVEEGELTADELTNLKSPTIPTKVVNALTDDQLRALLDTCKGKSFRDKRDAAIVRLMAETGVRANELCALALADVNVKAGVATIQRGKGGKGRIVPFGPQTAQALDRYIRARRAHSRARTDALWLGVGGKTFGYFGLNDTLRERAERAGIAGFHLHRMRHTFATRWLRANGSEGALMSVAGWSSRDMIDRYSKSDAAERAVTEGHRLNLGNL